MLVILKLIGCLFVVISSTSLGFLAAGELTRRAEDLHAFRNAAYLIQGDIRFNHSELPEVLNNLSVRHNSRLSSFFASVFAELQKHNGISFNEIWKHNSDIELKKTSLNSTDRKMINEFGENLGFEEREAQINIIERYIEEVDLKLSELQTISRGKKRIYKTLGFFGGLFITIILI